MAGANPLHQTLDSLTIPVLRNWATGDCVETSSPGPPQAGDAVLYALHYNDSSSMDGGGCAKSGAALGVGAKLARSKTL